MENNETSVWESDANQGRESKIPPVDFSTEYCGHAGLPGPDYVGPVILAGTDGDDYSVLDRVDPRIKTLAVEGKLTDIEQINEANSDTLDAAAGPGPEQLTPENKHWILKQLGFIGKGHGKFRHILLNGEFEFDLEKDLLVQLAFRLYKAGYKNAHEELNKKPKLML